MSKKFFRYGETVIRTVKTYTVEGDVDQILGTELVEVITTDAVPGIVVVRPHHGEDFIRVSIRDLSKAV